ncbi:SMI1/KNR4 family protein [Amycolatopsis rhizosphaerae]|uniref:SMI1/KNR4 family protein n=2 Tax=Amycolatopsis rhizosphaerae TaxID=2053003 RepID=A0A558DNV9_9PSEU|nr:SMI1/KNR4 family protein [Amycolatopsis rhizosphaerae]
MAAADAGCVVFGASKHRYRFGAPLRESAVIEFEQRHQVTLPESYRAFLVGIGDGGAGPYYGLFRLDGSDIAERDREDRWVPGLLATPFPHVTAWNPNGPDSLDRMSDEEYFAPEWVAGSLVIAEYGCGAFFRLILSGPARGQVWFDDRASDGGLTPGPHFRDWYLGWLYDEN